MTTDNPVTTKPRIFTVHREPSQEAAMLTTSPPTDPPIPSAAPLVPESPRPPGRELEREPSAASRHAEDVDILDDRDDRDVLDELDEAGDEPWARKQVARCADGHGSLTALFFSDNVHDIARAKAMCQLCPLKESCLTGALEREEPWGVWGGELLSGGRIIANKRPCGRPPKRPRPEIVYDELGPVGVVA